MMEENTAKMLQKYLTLIQNDLDRTVEFWQKWSHDDIYGGFFTCLGESGKLYDDTKYGWLQGRQVWTYARLYNEVDRFHTSEILQQAEKGGEFLMKYIKNPTTWRCHFMVTRDGKPLKVQKTIFSECFYLMGMAELAIATGKTQYKTEAVGMFEKIKHWVLEDDSDLGLSKLEGQTPTSSLAVPMMLLCIADQLSLMDSGVNASANEIIDWAIGQILAHEQRNGDFVLENVSVDGKELSGSQGRLTNPGHVIEAGWFLLRIAQQRNDSNLKEKAMKMFMLKAFNYGWDKEHGGIFYFLDVDGHCPTQLEWRQKLWWPHNEAMIAFLMAYDETDDETYLRKFEQVSKYSYSHFVDNVNGEWFGYLNQDGSKNMDFKGGPFKGCFHVPRCLIICERILRKLLNK